MLPATCALPSRYSHCALAIIQPTVLVVMKLWLFISGTAFEIQGSTTDAFYKISSNPLFFHRGNYQIGMGGQLVAILHGVDWLHFAINASSSALWLPFTRREVTQSKSSRNKHESKTSSCRTRLIQPTTGLELASYIHVCIAGRIAQ